MHGIREIIGEVGIPLYSDDAREIEAACRDEGLLHPTSTPYRKQCNGIAEANVQQTLRAIRMNLEQAGMPFVCFALAASHAITMFNAEWEDDEGTTPYERDTGQPFNAVTYPFGASIAFRPPGQK